MSGSASASFLYDGDGQRFAATINGVTTVYIGEYFEWQLATSQVTKYYFAGGQCIAMRVLPQGQNAAPLWLFGDHLGSTSVVANNDGSQHSRQGYMAWGEARFSVGSLPTKNQYTGQISHEAELGLYFYKARYYNPALSRWMQPDTLVPDPGNPLDWDRYQYVRSNPLKYLDPFGYKACEGRDAGMGESCSSADEPFTKKEIIDALKYENRFLRNLDLDRLDQDQLLDAYYKLSEFYSALYALKENFTEYSNSPETWSAIATGCDVIAWFIDFYSAGVVTSAFFIGAGQTSSAVLVGAPEVPITTGFSGMAVAEIFVQPGIQLGNAFALFATISTMRANFLSGDIFQPSTYNSITLTALGYANSEAIFSFILQSIVVGNDLNIWSLPF